MGAKEFDHELSVLKRGGKLLSLKTGPNKEFAIRNHLPFWKRELFSLAGAKYDKAAKKVGKTYSFMFVRADGEQLEKVTKIVEDIHLVPIIDQHNFSLAQANEALKLVASGRIEGKVIIHL